ncbi:MAG: hypothetical protein KDE20_12705, partial [Caldilineaceae bacterium]|nr:hypothetical protein [Caldilineaceae bacterium]
RTFDEKRDALRLAIQDLVTGRDESLQAVAGCDYNDFNTDSDAYYACIEDNIAALEACDATMASQEAYEACMDNVIVGDMKQAGLELRAAFLRIKRVQEELDNIGRRAASEEIRYVKVNSAVWENAGGQSVFAAIEVLLDDLSIQFGTTNSVSWNPASPFIALARTGSILLQAATDMRIDDAD